MEKIRNSRVSQVALATLLFLVVAFDSPPLLRRVWYRFALPKRKGRGG